MAFQYAPETVHGFQSVETKVTETEVGGCASYVICPANLQRRELYICNTGTRDLFVTFGPTTEHTKPSIIIPAYSSYPLGQAKCVWAGVVSAMRRGGATTEKVTVTELL